MFGEEMEEFLRDFCSFLGFFELFRKESLDFFKFWINL